ncbi:MAG TPA: hypothetical protein VF273_07350 [Pelobium sp.]
MKKWLMRITVAFFYLLVCSYHKNTFATTSAAIALDKNPVLISDSLKKTNVKLVLKSSLDKLSENIYFSSASRELFIRCILGRQVSTEKNLDFLEILALSDFYKGNGPQAEITFEIVFSQTKDSLQKAQTCINLIKLNYLLHDFVKAKYFINVAKGSLQKIYSNQQKYNLVFTEAKIALSEGLTHKAEDLIINKALPMSAHVKGKLNEYNCYLFLGKIYLKARKLTQAKWFFIQANTIALNKNYIDGEIETSLLLAKTKIKSGDFSIALQDLAKAKKLIGKNHQIYLEDLQNLTRLAKR